MEINKRNIAAYFMSCLYILTGRLRRVRQRAARKEVIISVYFHSPSRKLFEGCVRWFQRNGFTIISLEELEDIAMGRKPFPASAVILTADDGWRSNIDNIAAVANQHRAPVTIFASTNPIEKGEPYWWSVVGEAYAKGLTGLTVTEAKRLPDLDRKRLVEELSTKLSLGREAMTVDELQQISDTPYVHIGSHTVTHPMLPTCTDEASLYEIGEAGRMLQNWLSKDITYFAYPNGAYTEREGDNLKKSGYRLAFTTEPAYITPENIRNIYALPRFDVLETVSFTENICRMTGVWFNR